MPRPGSRCILEGVPVRIHMQLVHSVLNTTVMIFSTLVHHERLPFPAAQLSTPCATCTGRRPCLTS